MFPSTLAATKGTSHMNNNVVLRCIRILLTKKQTKKQRERDRDRERERERINADWGGGVVREGMANGGK